MQPFFYPGLDLSQMDLFKVVRGGQLVDDEEVPPVGETIVDDSQVAEDALHYGDVLED